jgi:hypothetical protein
MFIYRWTGLLISLRNDLYDVAFSKSSGKCNGVNLDIEALRALGDFCIDVFTTCLVEQIAMFPSAKVGLG